ncbi:MAG: MBL fold metallo-hydrolase [Paludibacteraceae bacterium]|nr:MBL fold metallo-hydrolase [Paludibacteraceae bacterium]
MKLTFLGTGTSTGVPYITCNCETCQSKDPKDRRLRCSSLLEVDGKNILLDCGPDFRQQALNVGLQKVDAVLLTHKHMDHVLGLDDLRPYGNVRIYSNKETIDAIHKVFSYCFNNDYKGIPQLETHVITQEPFEIDGITITPILIWHYKLPAFGYRIKDFAYITDYKSIDEDQLEKLKGLDVLVMDALRWEEHFSHASIDEAIAISKRLNPKRTYFIHMSHSAGLHEKTQKLLPPNIYLAYDGLSIEI